MILGVIIGVYAPHVQQTFDGAKFAGTSVRKTPPFVSSPRVDGRSSDLCRDDRDDVAGFDEGTIREVT